VLGDVSFDRSLCTRTVRALFAGWLGFVVAAAAPSLGRADDSGMPESSVSPSERTFEAEAAAASSGFNAPTLTGSWRTRIALHGWLLNVLKVSADTPEGSGSTTKDLGWLLSNLDWMLPIDVETRKGSFGAYVHTLAFKLDGTMRTGPADIEWKDEGFLMDLGLSYELGRWALGVEQRAPELRVEPFAGARLFYDPVDIDLSRVDRSTTDDFSNYVPIVGLRTFWDLTEHWNLRIEGDYGGFGIDDNHETWQVLGLVGYRWPGWGVHWNLQVGYRAMRIFDLRKGGDNVQLDARGSDVVFAVEF
jgi:hypothetical protein